jgi:hypothetical protein
MIAKSKVIGNMVDDERFTEENKIYGPSRNRLLLEIARQFRSSSIVYHTAIRSRGRAGTGCSTLTFYLVVGDRSSLCRILSIRQSRSSSVVYKRRPPRHRPITSTEGKELHPWRERTRQGEVLRAWPIVGCVSVIPAGP